MANDKKAGHALEGLEVTNSGLTATVGAGLIDGRGVAAVAAPIITAATTTYRGWLISEDGDGTYTTTMGTDDVGASSALALADALLIDVPAGGIAVATGSVNNTTTVVIDLTNRGKTPEVTLDATVSL